MFRPLAVQAIERIGAGWATLGLDGDIVTHRKENRNGAASFFASAPRFTPRGARSASPSLFCFLAAGSVRPKRCQPG
jgi:hypothetical protein